MYIFCVPLGMELRHPQVTWRLRTIIGRSEARVPMSIEFWSSLSDAELLKSILRSSDEEAR